VSGVPKVCVLCRETAIDNGWPTMVITIHPIHEISRISLWLAGEYFVLLLAEKCHSRQLASLVDLARTG